MAPPLYGGGHARMYVCGTSFYILRNVGVLPPMEGRVEWHRPCMGAVMPGCMSMACHSTSYVMSVSFHPWKDTLNGTSPVWEWLYPDVCPWRAVLPHTRHSSSIGSSDPGSYSTVSCRWQTPTMELPPLRIAPPPAMVGGEPGCMSTVPFNVIHGTLPVLG